MCSSHQVVHLRHSVDAGNVIRTNTRQNDVKYFNLRQDCARCDLAGGCETERVFLDLSAYRGLTGGSETKQHACPNEQHCFSLIMVCLVFLFCVCGITSDRSLKVDPLNYF